MPVVSVLLRVVGYFEDLTGWQPDVVVCLNASADPAVVRLQRRRMVRAVSRPSDLRSAALPPDRKPGWISWARMASSEPFQPMSRHIPDRPANRVSAVSENHRRIETIHQSGGRRCIAGKIESCCGSLCCQTQFDQLLVAQSRNFAARGKCQLRVNLGCYDRGRISIRFGQDFPPWVDDD